jgi:hypothetical protein
VFADTEGQLKKLLSATTNYLEKQSIENQDATVFTDAATKEELKELLNAATKYLEKQLVVNPDTRLLADEATKMQLKGLFSAATNYLKRQPIEGPYANLFADTATEEQLKKLLGAATKYLEKQPDNGVDAGSFAEGATKLFGLLTAILGVVPLVLEIRSRKYRYKKRNLRRIGVTVGVGLFFIAAGILLVIFSNLVKFLIIALISLLFLLIAMVIAATYLFQVLTSRFPRFKDDMEIRLYGHPESKSYKKPTPIEKLQECLELLRFYQETEEHFEEVITGKWGNGRSKARFRLKASKGDCAAWVIDDKRCLPNLIEVQFAKDDNKYGREVLEHIQSNCTVVRVDSERELFEPWPLSAQCVYEQVREHLKKVKNQDVKSKADRLNWVW